ncbi:hypothetical protein PICMEDRAFT_17454 [Pichia membranifaciens NRRL Y-2026]|uniref:Palmitoyl-protein thioesterase 1 n=1 Tax=Pichia membranifaciens NRRL Y-2026 TaxID=763406 RepID=A0A1E3NHA8_9ASCO|nr:hypothetical protein PICMEDRAFT_17454 [Pichia membranifaciens NRRL Y-2026]ODQ44948.1 hypothetical protein PICMEDRAFT_17454 [Pichia membranifaciens NRRL Y-2026]
MEIWGKLLGVLLTIDNASLITGPRDAVVSSIEHVAAPITETSSDRLPVLLWHGMGDSYESASMQWVSDTLQKEHPDLDIYSIYIDRDGGKDKEASILGDAMTQLTDVCEQIQNIEFDPKQGFNAIGFSQGGLFLRALVQTCDVRFHNLISFGSPQNGISDLPPCQPGNIFCERRNALIKSRIYTDYIQNNIIQAQYFRDVNDYGTYLEKSAFLKYVNNELFKDLKYYDRFVSLNKFVMVMFDKDEMLVPKESAWFYDEDQETGDLISFNKTDSYTFDLIGLKSLHDDGKIDFLKIDDLHLKISEKDLIYIAKTYL